MRIRRKNIAKDGSGSVDILAETADDMWHVLNLVQVGDEVRAPTYRKVAKEGLSGSTTTEKVGVTLSVKVEAVEYDQTSTTLRLKGKVCKANKWVRMGAYHTLELSSSALTTGAHKFSLIKQFWDSMHLSRLHSATSIKHKAEVAAVAVSGSESSVCLITDAMTIQLASIEAKAPSKRASSADRRDKAMKAYYQRITDAIAHHLPLDRIKALLIAGPGHFKEQLRMHLLEARAASKGTDSLQALEPSKIVMVQAMGGTKATVQAALADPGVARNLSDTRAAGDVAAVEDFFKAMREDEDRTAYSFKHVRTALDSAAVDTLLLADDLFRSPDVKTRAAYVALADEAKGQGVSVRVVSGMHPAGQQLAMMSGVAALLRYPMPHLQEMVEEAEKDRREGRSGGAGASSGAGTGGASASGAGADARDVLELGRGREGAWRGGMDEDSSTEEERESVPDHRDHSWLLAALETRAGAGAGVVAAGGDAAASAAAAGAGEGTDASLRVARAPAELDAVRRRRWCQVLACEATRRRDAELSGAAASRQEAGVSATTEVEAAYGSLMPPPGPVPSKLAESADGMDETLMCRAIKLAAGTGGGGTAPAPSSGASGGT